MHRNAIGREVPAVVEGIGAISPYSGVYSSPPTGKKDGPKIKQVIPGQNKLRDSLEQVIIETGLKDGMTISFHHHFREGDYIVNMVMEIIARLGIKDLILAPSSLTTVHTPLIEYIKNGVISRIETSGLRGPLADAISAGLMKKPVMIRSHGGRARAIESGEVHIDVAFLGVPSCDIYGNANGYTGKSMCGSLGYAMVDARHADQVILITDNLVPYPNVPASINQTDVDYIVPVNSIGDPSGIMTGATRYTTNPREVLIAEYAATVIAASGYFTDGFSMQSGSGGAALAVARFIREKMINQGIKASFLLGGIAGQQAEMLEEGLVEKIFDTQSFDQQAARSLGKNLNHVEIDTSFYANPHNKGCAVNQLDIVILSAMEIDTSFNVNVLTGSDGIIRGASGGHSDAAAGAKMTIVVAPLVRGRIPTLVENVTTVITPGESIDVLVTDRGIAVNPLRKDLLDRFRLTRLPIVTIEELKDRAFKITGNPQPIEYTEKIVGIVEYRDGTLLDTIRQVR